MNIIHEFESYSKLSTQKRINGMSKTYKSFLSRHVKALAKEEEEYSRDTLIKYLSSSNLAASTKALAAKGLSKFMKHIGAMDKEDCAVVSRSFRAPAADWSHIDFDKEMIDKLILYQQTKDAFIAARNSVAIILLSSIGLRREQLAMLTMKDIFIEGNVMKVAITRQKHRQKTEGREQAIKVVPLHNIYGRLMASTIVLQYLKERRRIIDSDGPFFITREGKPLSTKALYVTIKQDAEKLGYPNVNMKMFRHYVGNTVARTRGLVAASQLLGHTNIEITMRYVAEDKESEGL